MAKKAKLDILEITLDETIEKSLADDVDLVEQVDLNLVKEQGTLNILSKVKHWIHKPMFWIMLISMLFMGSLVGILFAVYQTRDEKGHLSSEKHTMEGNSAQSTANTIYLEGFIINQRENKQHVRIVLCDLAFSMVKSETAKNIDNDQIPMRNAIYEILEDEGMKEGLSVEGRGRLKERIKKELNLLLGGTLIENVYFTRYEII